MLMTSLSAPALPSVHRSLTHVKTADGQIHTAAAILDPLEAAGLSAARSQTRRDRNAGLRTYHCPDCDTALSIVVHAYGSTGIAGGRRAFFRHCGGAAARACVAAAEIARTPNAVNADRFAGRQEGPRHRAHKNLFAAVLEADPDFSAVAVEQAVTHGAATFWPDVQARLGARSIVFEVQHASPLLDTIQSRTAFYETAGRVVVWLVDGDGPEETFALQGFQDLAWPQGGRILALDDAGLAAGLRQGRAQALLITLHQSDDRLHITRERVALAEGIARVVPTAEALSLIATDPSAQRVFAALRQGDYAAIRATVEILCGQAGLPLTGRDAEADSLPPAIAALGTLFTGQRHDASGFGERDATAILNNFLSSRRRAVWAPLVARAADVSPCATGLLARKSTARKLAAALDATAGDPPVPDPVVLWAPVIARLFPQLGRVPIRHPAPG